MEIFKNQKEIPIDNVIVLGMIDVRGMRPARTMESAFDTTKRMELQD